MTVTHGVLPGFRRKAAPAAPERVAAREPATAPGALGVWRRRTVIAAVACGLWFLPSPEGIGPEAWHLFAVFVAAIASVMIGAFPILTASVIALAIAVLSGTLAPAKAYAGFANGTLLLIVVAFLVARAVVKCGLGARLGHLVVSIFGRSTLGLGHGRPTTRYTNRLNPVVNAPSR